MGLVKVIIFGRQGLDMERYVVFGSNTLLAVIKAGKIIYFAGGSPSERKHLALVDGGEVGFMPLVGSHDESLPGGDTES